MLEDVPFQPVKIQDGEIYAGLFSCASSIFKHFLLLIRHLVCAVNSKQQLSKQLWCKYLYFRCTFYRQDLSISTRFYTLSLVQQVCLQIRVFGMELENPCERYVK